MAAGRQRREERDTPGVRPGSATSRLCPCLIFLIYKVVLTVLGLQGCSEKSNASLAGGRQSRSQTCASVSRGTPPPRYLRGTTLFPIPFSFPHGHPHGLSLTPPRPVSFIPSTGNSTRRSTDRMPVVWLDGWRDE